MVVMETVRAATLATARRLERLSAEADKVKGQDKVATPVPSKAKQGDFPILIHACVYLQMHTKTRYAHT